MPAPHKQLTIVVGIIELGDQFLILRRVDDVPMWNHKWELPGGKIEAGEIPVDALRREVFEETGLQIREPQLLGVHTHHWHLPELTQQTFLIVYTASADSEGVSLNPEESDAYQWVTLDEFFMIPDHLEANKEMITSLYAPFKQRK